MWGLSVKRGVFLLQMLEFQQIIYEMEEVFFLFLMIYLILKLNMKEENCIWKSDFFTFIFWASISQLIIHYGV